MAKLNDIPYYTRVPWMAEDKSEFLEYAKVGSRSCILLRTGIHMNTCNDGVAGIRILRAIHTHTQTSQTPSSVVDDTSALLVYYYCVLLHTIYDVNGWIPTWKISMNQPTCDNKIIDLSQRHISNEHFCDSQSRISPFSHCGRVFLN